MPTARMHTHHTPTLTKSMQARRRSCPHWHTRTCETLQFSIGASTLRACLEWSTHVHDAAIHAHAYHSPPTSMCDSQRHMHVLTALRPHPCVITSSLPRSGPASHTPSALVAALQGTAG